LNARIKVCSSITKVIASVSIKSVITAWAGKLLTSLLVLTTKVSTEISAQFVITLTTIDYIIAIAACGDVITSASI
jgi:hypothetical protein